MPAVTGENLPQLVQRGATLGKGDQALLRRCIGAERGLVAEDPRHVGAGKPAQEETQTFDDRAAIACIGRGQERPDHGVTDQPFPVEHHRPRGPANRDQASINSAPVVP